MALSIKIALLGKAIVVYLPIAINEETISECEPDIPLYYDAFKKHIRENTKEKE